MPCRSRSRYGIAIQQAVRGGRAAAIPSEVHSSAPGHVSARLASALKACNRTVRSSFDGEEGVLFLGRLVTASAYRSRLDRFLSGRRNRGRREMDKESRGPVRMVASTSSWSDATVHCRARARGRRPSGVGEDDSGLGHNTQRATGRPTLDSGQYTVGFTAPEERGGRGGGGTDRSASAGRRRRNPHSIHGRPQPEEEQSNRPLSHSPSAKTTPAARSQRPLLHSNRRRQHGGPRAAQSCVNAMAFPGRGVVWAPCRAWSTRDACTTRTAKQHADFSHCNYSTLEPQETRRQEAAPRHLQQPVTAVPGGTGHGHAHGAVAASASTVDTHVASIDRTPASQGRWLHRQCIRKVAPQQHGSPADGARPVPNSVLWYLPTPGSARERGCWRQNAHNAAMDHAVGCAVGTGRSKFHAPWEFYDVTQQPAAPFAARLANRIQILRHRLSTPGYLPTPPPLALSLQPAAALGDDTAVYLPDCDNAFVSVPRRLGVGPPTVPADMTAYAAVGISTRTAQMATLHIDLINTGLMSRTPPPFRCAST
ncbi:hypothetical protein PMIN01_01078 [Paraphaeosphaeria minitans]|uniref:Uncharacterized protein n=1 Tax=Paraphaeosphaeria minitans TaxID=565426 RepID=A0A9P6GU03_9PLEO|nr:hypothetical protein PMIN01_01078 [Paraphaeosphaeria minitans]